MTTRRFLVAGYVEVGMYEYDVSLAYTTLALAQEFAGLADRVTGVEVKLADPFAAKEVGRAIAARLRPGQLVVLESTTYPGTTEELILPMLAEGGLQVGKDFFLAFSPERVDPGNERFNTRNTPKIIGGVTPACTQVARSLYGRAVERVIPPPRRRMTVPSNTWIRSRLPSTTLADTRTVSPVASSGRSVRIWSWTISSSTFTEAFLLLGRQRAAAGWT